MTNRNGIFDDAEHRRKHRFERVCVRRRQEESENKRKNGRDELNCPDDQQAQQLQWRQWWPRVVNLSEEERRCVKRKRDCKSAS
jgi:hypothetical protein